MAIDIGAGINIGGGIGIDGVAALPPTLPTVTGVSPNFGYANGNTYVEVYGTLLDTVTSCSIDGIVQTSFANFGDPNLAYIFQTAPGVAGTGLNVSVTNPDGTSVPNTLWTCLPAVPFPTVTSISPNNGPAAGGTPVTITGSGFTAGDDYNTYPQFGDLLGSISLANVTIDSTTQISGITNPFPPGVYNVLVVTPATGPANPATLTNGWTYT